MRLRFTILTLLLLLLGTSCQRQAADSPVVRQAMSPKAAAKAPGRPVFPYSVVSGGLTSPDEMAKAIKQDPVVSEHYAGLRPASFRSEVLQEDRKGYVSYRIRDKVYWTRRLMTLKKGEMVLTNGDTMLRGRCGNRISSIAMSPAAPASQEPTEAVLNSWQDSKLLAGIPPVPTPSPIGGALKFDRSAPEDPSAASLLLPPDSQLYGLIVPSAHLGSPGAFLVAGGGSPGGAGGGGVVGGGAPPEGTPSTVPGPDPGLTPPTGGHPPLLIASLPPFTERLLPPSERRFTIAPPNPIWPPMVTYPPTSMPPGTIPPFVDPPTTNPPGTTPPFPPTGTPRGEVPPGVGAPPPYTPPTVSDPPPSYSPPGPPEDETAVPEPATILLAASALAVLGAGRYLARRRN